MTKHRKTVGEEAVKRLNNIDTSQGIIDTQREMDKEYFSELQNCVNTHKSWDTPFYIVVHCKKERLLENVVRRYFIGRQTLPTPQWDQTVWRYNPKNGDLQFLWVLPDENTAKWLAGNPYEVHQEHEELLSFVIEFLNKRLYSRFYKQFHKGEKECLTLESSYSEPSSKAVLLPGNAKV